MPNKRKTPAKLSKSPASSSTSSSSDVDQEDERELDSARLFDDIFRRLTDLEERIGARSSEQEPTSEATREVASLVNTLTDNALEEPSAIKTGLAKLRKRVPRYSEPPMPSAAVGTAAAAEARLLKDTILDVDRILHLLQPAFASEETNGELSKQAMVALAIGLARLMAERMRYRLWELIVSHHGDKLKKEARELLVSSHWKDDVRQLVVATQARNDQARRAEVDEAFLSAARKPVRAAASSSSEYPVKRPKPTFTSKSKSKPDPKKSGSGDNE